MRRLLLFLLMAGCAHVPPTEDTCVQFTEPIEVVCAGAHGLLKYKFPDTELMCERRHPDRYVLRSKVGPTITAIGMDCAAALENELELGPRDISDTPVASSPAGDTRSP